MESKTDVTEGQDEEVLEVETAQKKSRHLRLAESVRSLLFFLSPSPTTTSSATSDAPCA